jgi:hypothetical protein
VRSDAFVGFMVAAAKQGSAAKITNDYADSLTRVLKLRTGTLTGDETAHEALQAISDALFTAFPTKNATPRGSQFYVGLAGWPNRAV